MPGFIDIKALIVRNRCKCQVIFKIVSVRIRLHTLLHLIFYALVDDSFKIGPEQIKQSELLPRFEINVVVNCSS